MAESLNEQKSPATPAAQISEKAPQERSALLTAMLSRKLMRDYALMALGALLTALALNCFLIPGEMAAGGASGLATIIYHLGLRHGVVIPVGLQTLLMNALLMIPVVRSGGLRYASRTIFGIVMLSACIDITAPFLPHLVGDEMLIAAIWGGVISGVGLGLVFRAGGNTGGTDIVAQLIARKSSLSVGAWLALIDIAIVIISAPIFSSKAALCAGVAMGIASLIIDRVVDGPITERAAWIITESYEEVAPLILHDLGRGCTLLSGRGMWSGNERPVLFVVLSRREVGLLKTLVASVDPHAIVIISDVNEAFGEGFKEMGVQ